MRNIDGKEKPRLVASHRSPDWCSNPQPKYVPWTGIKPTTLWCKGRCANQLNHPARPALVTFTGYFWALTGAQIVNFGFLHNPANDNSSRHIETVYKVTKMRFAAHILQLRSDILCIVRKQKPNQHWGEMCKHCHLSMIQTRRGKWERFLKIQSSRWPSRSSCPLATFPLQQAWLSELTFAWVNGGSLVSGMQVCSVLFLQPCGDVKKDGSGPAGVEQSILEDKFRIGEY